MLHSVTCVTANKAEGRPVHAQCSCGTGGDFGSAYDAAAYFAKHFAGLQGVCKFEFKDETVPEPVPETPAEPVVPVDPEPEVKPDDPEGAGTVHDVPEVPAEDPDRTSGVG